MIKQTAEEVMYKARNTVTGNRVRKTRRMGQKRQIVVQFNSYKNKLDLLRNCKKLKGTNLSVFEDFSKETASIRKQKWKAVLKNWKDGTCNIKL